MKTREGNKIAILGYGRHALALAASQAGLMGEEARGRAQTCDMTPEEIAERDRPISRQVRRQKDRLAKKKHSKEKQDD